MDVVIRDAVPTDAEAITRVLNPIIEARVYTVLDEPFSTEAEQEFISRFPKTGVWKVAVLPEDGRIAGFQILEPFAAYTKAFDHVGIVGTYIDLDLRRRGIAKALFGATVEAARRKGYEKLFTFVRADNAAALATYLAHGFTTIGTARRHAKIGGRYVDEVLIERAL